MNKEQVSGEKRPDNIQNIQTDSALLNEELTRLFYANISDTLNILSSRFPHTKNDGSQNELEFNGLRSKILRSGNNQIRKMPDVLKDYHIIKTHDTTEEQVVIVGEFVKLKKQEQE